MLRRPTIWFLLSLLCFAGALVFWRLGDQWAARKPAPASPAPAKPSNQVTDTTPLALRHGQPWHLLSAAASSSFPGGKTNRSLRLSNADFKLSEWTRRPTAVLLENALIDTPARALVIPEHLRAQGEHGTFIVQARDRITEAFRATLRDAGANVVAYIPNNAYLVRVPDAAAQRLTGLPGVQSVLPYEPYYKLKTDLLRCAVDQSELPLGQRLNLALFADAREATLDALAQMGARVLLEEASPFGPVVTVEPATDSLVALAGLPGVQVIEAASARAAANDLSRARVGVAADTQVAENYLGLTGTNVMISVNDSGVDATHPDLEKRMFALDTNVLVDANGHGTHVIGTIAGTGLKSDTVTNASGSVMPGTNGQFRGAAPAANVFVQQVIQEARPGRAGASSPPPDSALQQNAARTNAFISNNSWHYTGNNGYDLAAARYDAATRDALPEDSGAQPLLFVFAAGNAGRGEDAGAGGVPDSITSPGTAKNVITVGALEQVRSITNEVWKCTSCGDCTNANGQICSTNTPWAQGTDTADEVAAYSSRGNVGIGVEGLFGRYKPDVVAPGSWVISARSQQWDQEEYYNPTNYYDSLFENLQVKPGKLRNYSIYIPANAVRFWIDLLQADDSPSPFPDLPIFVRQDATPTTSDPVFTNHVAVPTNVVASLQPGGTDTAWNYSVGTTNEKPVWFNLFTRIATTNDNGNMFEVHSNLNRSIGPWYRYESGSSMSAAQVSGTLALMQEFFQERLGYTNSPALMKAFLINGARSLGRLYDFEVKTVQNYQGWGLVNLPTTLPGALTNYNPVTSSILFFDQSATNALATGDRHVRQIQLTDEARTVPLRVTLVWTDPPGNPAAGVKLVNDLDLVVTNLDTGEVFFGNDFAAGGAVTQPWYTNDPPNVDVVNNVENIYLPDILGTNYSITVLGSRVNVNAVPGHTNDTVQDYALVISSGDGDIEGGITLTAEALDITLPRPNVTWTTNSFQQATNVTGTLLLGQHVGANTPLLNATNGMTNQWHFFVLTNTANYTNAAFVTFLSYDLSLPRIGVNEPKLANATRVEADIDMYVSTDPKLLDLDPDAIANARKSRTRGGTEVVAYSNAAPQAVYYVGVKAEDQMAAEFGFVGVFSLLPFMDDDNGNFILRGFPLPAYVPDGSPSDPGAGFVFALCIESIPVRRVVVTNTVTHENFGDLLGSISHNNIYAALNNHTFPPGNPPPLRYMAVYEDNEEGDIPNAQRTDGPGSLRDFVGEEGIGLWLLQMVDDANTQTGRVDFLSVRLEPQMIDETGGWRGIMPFSFSYDFVNVPATATNLEVCVTTTNGAPLELYVRRGDFPTRTEYDKKLDIGGAAGTYCLTINRADLPPLTEGRYYIGIYNPTPTVQYVRLVVKVELDPNALTPLQYTWIDPMDLTDDAVTNAVLQVTNITNPSRIASVNVGVRIDHPRVSDLQVTLVSPKGTRVLLAESRGWTNEAGFGSTYMTTNVFLADEHVGSDTVTNIIDVGGKSGTLQVFGSFAGEPDQMTVYYEGAQIYDTSMAAGDVQFDVDFGPGTNSLVTVVMNEHGNTNAGTRWSYDIKYIETIHNYLVFTESTNLTRTPIKFEELPLASVAEPTNIFFNGFELAALGDYRAPQTFDGWTVLTTNPVTVIQDPALAWEGGTLLALARGTISRALPTRVGRHYALNYAYRGPGIVGLWQGENNAVDRIYGNNGSVQNVSYRAGVVGRAFECSGKSSSPYCQVSVPDQPNFELTTSLSIEGWINPAGSGGTSGIILWRGDCRGGHDPYFLSVNSDDSVGLYIEDDTGGPAAVVNTPSPLTVNRWWHVAGTLDDTTGIMRIYTNGVLAAQTSTTIRPFGSLISSEQPTIGIGNAGTACWFNIPFNGALDEISLYSRALSGSEIKAIFEAGSAGKFDPGMPGADAFAKAEVTIDGGVPEVFYGNNTNWQTRTIEFIATQEETDVTLAGLEPGMLLDSFTLTEMPGPLYVVPEERLGALTDENAYGAWKLEILDTRASGTNDVLPQLLSWQLSFIFQNDIPIPGVLQTGEPKTNTVPAGYIAYYVVDVPIWATAATNSLLFASTGVNLWFNQLTPPFGTNTGDYLLLNQSTAGRVTLTPATTPRLLPGRRYYLGVQNTNAVAVDYALQVDFDITVLANAVPVTSTLAATSIPRYFSFDVTANGTAAWFALTNLSGNVELVARRGAPLPTPADHDYGSFSPGTASEEILVFTNSVPVPLTAGRWYLGVFNADMGPVSYSIVAVEFTTPWPPIITLTNGIPYATTNSLAAGAADYYRYVVTGEAARAQFEINSPSGDVSLVAHRGLPLPTLSTFDYISTNVLTNDELIVVFTNSTPVALSPGSWYLTAVKVPATPVSYTIKATEWPEPGQPIAVVGAEVTSTNFCLTWTSVPGAHYVVEGLTNLNAIQWNVVSPQITAADVITQWCLPLPAPYHFFRVKEGLLLQP